MFTNRKVLIATKHNKEQVIAPLFENALGLQCRVFDDFDTDAFGTFSGEIDRADTALVTVKKKAWQAMEQYGFDLVIASEGSFGTHPQLFFATANEEYLIFIDKCNNLEICIKELSLDTNFNASFVESYDELLAFASQCKFPSHGLILRKDSQSKDDIVKGIVSDASLKAAFDDLYGKFGKVYVETDMRALYNPTRMSVIEQAAKKLIEKIQSLCPKCQSPGFGEVHYTLGLPCEWCKCPTNSILSVEKTCMQCNFKTSELYPNKKECEDPMYCDNCNP